LNLAEAAEALGTSQAAVQRLIAQGKLNARQARPGAPWVIQNEALAQLTPPGYA